MPDVAEISERIQALCARAPGAHPDARMLVEIEDLLAEGYLCAMHADHYGRRLQKRLEALVEAVDTADAAQQLQAVARERRVAREAAQELRSQLAVLRQHWVALGSDRLGLA